MKKLFTVLCFLGATWANAQTNPTPYDFSAGPYTFSAWDSASTPGTYPPNMVFHCDTLIEAPVFNAVANYTCRYNQTARARMKGRNALGFSFLNAGSSLSDTCGQMGNANSIPVASRRFMGAAVLALNTTGLNNVLVSWTGRMLSNVLYGTTPGRSTRLYAVQLQYRVGTTGTWTDVPGSVFNSFVDTVFKAPGTTEVIPMATLPADCDNQPVVQLRWNYRMTNSPGAGQRAELGVDEIVVGTNITTALGSKPELVPFACFPNPNTTGILRFTTPASICMFDAKGQLVLQTQNTLEADVQHLGRGVYQIITLDGQKARVVIP
jgi:hypothetical protein